AFEVLLLHGSNADCAMQHHESYAFVVGRYLRIENVVASKACVLDCESVADDFPEGWGASIRCCGTSVSAAERGSEAGIDPAGHEDGTYGWQAIRRG
ncbi:hypothetical protein AB4144_10355, partial [Rhizobiaceae sp. 2RAB30]